MILGTAGHIDHGKTSLVKALTGVDTDRLAEEKRRGITIELGFAHLSLDDGTVAGLVDVPGHERFVKAMAAGAGGVDLVILVVAADEGVMPQTREHLDICRLLGVKAGVVAVTKADLLEELGPGWLDVLREDVAQLCEGTFLEGAPLVPVSARTGQGLGELRAALTRAAKALPARPSEGPLFLPVDRAFTRKGFGTVVTGTLLSGQLAVDEQVSLLPGLEGPLRVRGLQAYGAAVGTASAGQRAAVNLAGVEAEAVRRGRVLTRPGEVPPTRMLDVELTLLPAADAPLPRRRKLLLHLGTTQVPCTVALLDADELRPGHSALAQLRLAADVAALSGQRFILRGSRALPGRGATLAGGRVLAQSASRRRRGQSAQLRPLLEGELSLRLGFLLRQAGYGGLTFRALCARAGVGPKAAEKALIPLSTRGEAVLVDRERRLYLARDVLSALSERALALLLAFHEREPSREGMGKEELRQRLWSQLEPRVFARVCSGLLEAGRVEPAQGDLLRLPGRSPALGEAQAKDQARLLALLAEAGLSPPRPDELAGRTGLPPARVQALLRALCVEGQARKVTDEMFFHTAALDGLRDRLVAHLKAEGEISTQAFKDLVGQSRKYVIPLSEYFDRERVTLRVGDKRLLRRG
jgi:selenocysteine-specific elongation factor